MTTTTTGKYAEGLMVQYRDGYYQITNAAEVEDWSTVMAEADAVESLGKLMGWDDWAEAFRLSVNGCDLYYFAR